MKKKLITLVLVLALAGLALVGCTGGSARITITFDTMGGNTVPPMKVRTDAESLDLPTPIREGYNFDSWYYDSALSDRVDTSVIPTEDVTFYAGWTAKTIVITFNSNPKKYSYVPYGGNLMVSDMPAVPESADYPGYVGRWITGDLINVTSPMTIECEYIPVAHYVTYIVDGEIYTQYSGAAGTALTSPPDPEEEGRLFLGWYAEETFENHVVPPTVMGNEDVTLYAWFATESDSAFFRYSVNDGEVYIEGLSGAGRNLSSLVIPSEIEGMPVTRINRPDMASQNLTQIVVPHSVKIIGDFALAFFPQLTRVVLEEGVEEIGVGAFAGNPSLRTAEIPATVNKIGDYAFAAVTNENVESESEDETESEKVEFPDGEYSWQEEDWYILDTALSKVEIADGSQLETVGKYVFFGTKNLLSFNIPSAEKYVFDIDFLAYSSVGEITVSSDNATYAAENGALYSKDYKTFLYLPRSYASTSFVLNATTETISERAFEGAKGLVTATFAAPASGTPAVTEIGDYAFLDCENLLSVVTNGANIAKIGTSAFENTALSELPFNTALTEIGNSSFRNSGVGSVDFSLFSLNAIADHAFADCENLNVASFTGSTTLTDIGSGAFSNCLNLVTASFTSSKIVNVGDFAFQGDSALGTFALPTSALTIGNYAFADCTALTSAHYGSVTSIGDYAFLNTPITSIRFEPNVVTHLGIGAYKNCRNIQSIRIPTGISRLPDEIFYGCVGVGSAPIPATITEIGDYAFYGCTRLSGVSYTANSLVKIGAYAFANCTALNVSGSNPIFPSSVTTLGEGAFYNCSSLTTLTLYGNLKEIPESAFANCASLNNIDSSHGALTYIGKEAFANCVSLVKAQLPNTLDVLSESTGIFMNPFIGCENLTAFELFGSGSYLFVSDGVIYGYLDDTAGIYLYPTGKSGFEIPESVNYDGKNYRVTSVSDYAFYGASNLSEVRLASGISSGGQIHVPLVRIGEYAFSESTATAFNANERVNFVEKSAFENTPLTTLSISQSLLTNGEGNYVLYGGSNNRLTIDDGAFRNTGVNALDIPARVDHIGNGAFENCYNLSTLTFDDGTGSLSIGEQAFANASMLTALVFPAQLGEIGNGAFENCYNLSSVDFSDVKNNFFIGDYAFSNAHYLKTATFSTFIRGFGEGAFAYDTRLETVVFPTTKSENTFTEISDKMFLGCANLKEISLPQYIVSIGESAFAMTAVSSLSLVGDGSSAFDIGAYAFAETPIRELDLVNIGSVAFGAYSFAETPLAVLSVGGADLKIGSHAFERTALTSLELGSGDVFGTEDSDDTGEYAFFASAITELNATDAETIPAFAFAETPLETATISGSNVIIGENAFEKTAAFKTFTVRPTNSLTVGARAFGNSSIATFTVENENITYTISELAFENSLLENLNLQTANSATIGTGAFSGTRLASIAISSSSAELAEGLAYNAPYLTEITVTIDGYETSDGVLYKISPEGKTLLQYPAGKSGSLFELTEESGVVRIGAHAFDGNKNLTAITFDTENDVEIGVSAFDNTDSSLTVYAAEDKIAELGSHGVNCEVLQKEAGGVILKKLSGNRYRVTGYAGNESELVLLGSMTVTENGVDKIYRVESIDSYAFANNVNLRKITLGSGISTVGDYAFYRCANLEEVVFKGVTDLGTGAFESCVSLRSIDFGKYLKNIGSRCFYGCGNLGADGELVLPDSLATISSYAFANAVSLADIRVGSGLVSIGNSAFSGDTNIISLTLPSSLGEIGSYAFNGCENLTFLYLGNENSVPVLKSVYSLGGISPSLKIFVSEKVLRPFRQDRYWSRYSSRIIPYTGISGNYVLSMLRDGEYSLICYLGTEADVEIESTLGSGEITGRITEIGTYSFTHFTRNVTLGEGIVKIAESAFVNATHLESVTLPQSLESIGRSAFEGLKELRTVEFPEPEVSGGVMTAIPALKEIGARAFYDCSALESLSLPVNLEKISDYAFAGEQMHIQTIVFNGGLYVTRSDSTSGANTYLQLTLGNYAFMNNVDVSEIVFNCTVTQLGAGTFAGCTSLAAIYFNSDMTSRDVNGNNIPVIAEIPDGVSDTFENCDMLAILVPSERATAYRQRWKNRFDINRVYGSHRVAESYEDDMGGLVAQGGLIINELSSGDGYNAAIIGYLGSGNTENPGELKIPEYVRFGNIPYRVTRLGRDENNTDVVNGRIIGDDITKVIIPSSVTTITADAFRGAKGLMEIEFANETPSQLTRIESHAFADCPNLERVALPKSLTSLGDYAFANCGKLNSVTIEEFSSADFNITRLNMGQRTFENCESLASFNVPRHVGALSDYAFYGLSNLTEVTFPVDSNTESVGAYAFAGTGLEEITLPQSIQSVGAYAFADCENLRAVRLTRVITSSVRYVTRTQANVFYGNASPFIKVYVPNEAAYADYARETGWNTSASQNGNDSGVVSMVIPETHYSDFDYRILNNNTVSLTHYRGSAKRVSIPAAMVIGDTTYRIVQIDPYFGNEDIEEIVFNGSNLAYIDNYAFAGCVSLKRIDIPDSVTNMGTNVFEKCSSLADVEISSSMGGIPDYTFLDCTSLREVTLPDNIKAIGAGAFSGCSSLYRLEVLANNFENGSASIGSSCLTGTSASLVIIVPVGRQTYYAAEWADRSRVIYERGSLFGDYVLRSVEGGYQLVQYSGYSELDPENLVINGRKVVSFAENYRVNN